MIPVLDLNNNPLVCKDYNTCGQEEGLQEYPSSVCGVIDGVDGPVVVPDLLAVADFGVVLVVTAVDEEVDGGEKDRG